jgi:NADP-reducing hydrogenase subunit HndB
MAERINDPRALNALRDQAKKELALRDGQKQVLITVHMSTCGIAAGARAVLSSLMAELKKANADDVTLRHSACAGLCEQEPMITVVGKDGREYRYGKLDQSKVVEIVQSHVLQDKPVQRYLINA